MAQCQVETRMGRVGAPRVPESSFPNSVRGDVSVYRFEAPKSSALYNAHGYSTVGLADRPGRKIISHDFEQQKGRENSASIEKQLVQPQGQRFAAGLEWHKLNQMQRSQQEHEEEQKQVKHEQDSLQGIVHQLPEYIGSASNPLLVRPHTAPAATGRTAAAAAAVEASGYSFCSRPHSPEVAARVQTARNLDSSLAIGSLEPLVDEAAEEAERQRQSLLGMMLAEHQARLLAADQLANQMVKLYPHGVPKRVQLELKQKGVELPGLGFGCAHSVPAREAAFVPTR